jgi:uncharacterized protein YndB with AHSA1/START domain
MQAVNTQDYGELQRWGERPVLRYDRHLPHGPEKVWRALTEDEHLDAWFPTTFEGDRTAGAALTFNHRHRDLPPMEGEMRAFEPPSLLEFTWAGDVVRFELTPEGDGTALALIVEMEEFGKLARDGAGWHVCLDNLGRSLDSESPLPHLEEHWHEVNAGYTERLGPEAATVGIPR